MALVIGISKGSGSAKYANYAAWLIASGEEVETVDLSAADDPEREMARLDALLLSGGSDIDPERYGRPDLEPVCTDIDRDRDALEFMCLTIADERELPVLAICRGMQIVNVHHNGTLFAHLPDAVPGSERHQKENGADRQHELDVEPGSLLFKATGELHGTVNSAHHQAVDRLGESLVVTARAADGVIEAIERIDHVGKAYLLAVQWHPERMSDPEGQFSGRLREQFLFEARSAQILARSSKPLPRVSEPSPDIDDEQADPANGLLPIIR